MNKNVENLDVAAVNLEDVESTIKEIKKERQKRPVRDIAWTVVKWIFFPVTLTVTLFSLYFRKKKVRLTTKTTIIFTVIFGILICAYVIFVMHSFNNYFKNAGDPSGFLTGMIITSVILVVLFIFIGAAAGAYISNSMLKPVRTIISQIHSIDGDNLNKRLDEVDSQDEIRELVDQINTMLDSLEKTFEQQSNFVADASHELKTPLSVITGYGSLLDRWGKEDPKVLAEGIEAVKRESAYMAKIIDQMLLLARLGSFNMVRQKFSLIETVSETVGGYTMVDPSLRLVFEAGESVVMETDKALLTQAIRAIIDNAIKYTPAGGEIRVFAGYFQGYEEESRTVISVRDTGIGMDEESLPLIFNRFYRCDKTRGREKGSAGLGLTICKSIVEIMEGHIEVYSQKGKGSEFRIVF